MKMNSLLRCTSLLVLASLCLGPLAPICHAAVGGAPVDSKTPVRWMPRLMETDANNLVPNSGFELGTAGWSSLGETTAWGGDLSSLYGTVTTTEKFEGDRSLEIVR